MNSTMLINFFKFNGIHFQLIEDSSARKTFSLTITVKSCFYNCLLDIYGKKPQIASIHSIFPVKVPAEKARELSVFIALYNNTTSFGCWELDIENGVLKFRCSFPIEEKKGASIKNISENMLASANILDTCTAGIISIVFNNQDSEVVFNQMNKRVNARWN